MRAPDYPEPILAWRSWLVVARVGAFRLCSPVFPTIWPPRRPKAAACRCASVPWRRVPRHAAPQAFCRCGIYGSAHARNAGRFAAELDVAGYRVVGCVLGRVSLWGTVVEHEGGWRASRAYPAALSVAAARAPRPSLLPRRRPSVAGAEIALALEAYGVPVELLACETLRGLAEVLEEALTP